MATYSTKAAKQFIKESVENGLKILVCTVCNMHSNYLQSMYRHMLIKHTARADNLHCPQCGKSFQNNIYYSKHLRSAHCWKHL
jgi:transcription elongation factor Elf1